MEDDPGTLKACADLSEKARFLNAFVRTQRSRQNSKAGKSAWLEDERMLRQQERSLEDDVQKRFECMAVSWLPSADAAQHRQNLEEAHTDEMHLRMNRQCVKERAKAGHCGPGQAASLARHEVQLAANLEQQAASLQHEIKQRHHRATQDDKHTPGWWNLLDLARFSSGEHASQSCDSDHHGAATEHLLQQAHCSASGPNSEADGNGPVRDHDPRHQQWQKEAADEAMEVCAKHKLATVEAHACVQDAFQALHGNFHKAAQKALEGLAQTQRDVPETWNQDDELAFHAAMAQVVNSIKTSATRGEILDAVQHRMPGKSLSEIRRMDRKIWQDYTCKTKRRELAQMWMRQHSAVAEECEQLLLESEAGAMQHALFSAKVVEAEVAKQRAQLQHEQCCQVHEHVQLEKQVAEASKQARAAAAARAQKDAMLQKHEVSKLKVQVHRQRLASHAVADRQAAMESLKVAELRRQPQRLQNAMRVRFRDKVACEKQAEKNLQLQAQRAEEQARESRLKRIRAMVTVNVQPDKERPLKPTKCMLAEAYHQHSVFADMHGYSADVVTSDRRHRAMAMMRCKGLLEKSYAQDTLRQMYNSARPKRIDCLTSDQLLGSYVAPRMM